MSVLAGLTKLEQRRKAREKFWQELKRQLDNTNIKYTIGPDGKISIDKEQPGPWWRRRLEARRKTKNAINNSA